MRVTVQRRLLLENHFPNATLLPASSVQDYNSKNTSYAMDLGSAIKQKQYKTKQSLSLTLPRALRKLVVKCPGEKS